MSAFPGHILSLQRHLLVFLGAVLCLFLPVAVHAQTATGADPKAIFQQANAAFAAQKWNAAREGYEKLIQEGHACPAVFFNLGNTLFREGKTGPAILNYKRALALNPRDPDAQANLLFVMKSAGLFPPDIPWWQKPFLSLSLNGWTLFGTVMLAVFCLARSAAFLRLGPSRIFKTIAWICLLGLAACLPGIILTANQTLDAVAVADPVPLRISPFDTAAPSSTIKEGAIVRILKKHEGFYLVKTTDGKTGWAQPQQVEPVIPECR